MAIFKRNLQYLTRNPRSVNALMFSGTFSALLDLALYFQVGKIDPNWDPNQYTTWIFNMKGFSLMIANSIQFSTSASVILQIPLQLPVFKRENANQMYSPTAYFLGRITSNILVQLFYPISTVLVLFWGLSIETSLQNFLMFNAYAILLNVESVAQAYFCGTLSSREDSAN